MSKDYQRELATANRLLTKFGGPADLLQSGHVSGPAYDPILGPDIETPCTVCNVGENSITRVPGYQVQAGSLVGFMAANGPSPMPSERLRVAGVVYTISDVKPLQPNPAGAVVLYEFVASR